MFYVSVNEVWDLFSFFFFKYNLHFWNYICAKYTSHTFISYKLGKEHAYIFSCQKLSQVFAGGGDFVCGFLF